MNCKPGDLAVIVGNNPLNPDIQGRIVDVLYAAPAGDFELPDGKMNVAPGVGFWVVKFQNPVRVALEFGGTRQALYGCCPDSRLRPLRDGDGDDETLTWAGKPSDIKTPSPVAA